MKLEEINLQIEQIRAGLSSLIDKMENSSVALPLVRMYIKELERFEQGLCLGKLLGAMSTKETGD